MTTPTQPRKKFYITTPIYYVNDKPHLGHVYTTVAADVLARYRRSQGDDVLFLTGTDEHGDKVAASAQTLNMPVQEFVDRNAESFRNAFTALNVDFDVFQRTTLPSHAESVEKFLTKLYEAGALYEGTYEGLYCKGCEDFYLEKDLVDGKCPFHLTRPEIVQEQNWFFRLSHYLPDVRALIESNQLVIDPPERRNEVLAMIERGVPDFSVTRQRVAWGLTFPFDDTQKVYVWAEALPNYLSGIGYGRDDEEFALWWPADVHLMAKDILKFHAVYWPAMLLAAGLTPPHRIFAHGFFTLNGQKMSKSLGNVLDPNDLVARYGADATRYLLLSQFQFGQDGDLSASAFDELYASALVNGLGNVVARVAKMVEQYADGAVDRAAQPDDAFNQLVQQYHKELDGFRLYGAAKTIQSVIRLVDEDIERVQPWTLAKTDVPAVSRHLARWTACLLAVADLVSPFMPQTGRNIRETFSADRIVKGEPLFPRMSADLGNS